MAQQQRSIRHAKRFTAWFGTHGYTHEGQTLNLSDRGLALKVSSVFPSGTKLRVAVKPSDQPAFELEGVVVWAQTEAQNRGLGGMMGLRLVRDNARYVTFIGRQQDPVGKRTELTPPNTPVPAASKPPTVAAFTPPPPVIAPPPPALHITPAPVAPPVIAAPRAAVSFDAFLSAAAGSTGSSTGTMSVSSRAVSISPPSSVSIPPPSGRLRMPRFDDQLPLRWGVQELDRRGFTVNLSRTGLAFRTTGEVEPGSRLLVAVTLPEGQAARGTGIATWQRLVPGEPGSLDVGVRLLHADNRYLALLTDLAARR